MRCFTVLFACGWFLMSPPRIGDGPEVDAQRPVADWVHQKSFDSAAQCEQFRVSLMATAMGNTSGPAVYTRNVATQGRCLPSDFPGQKKDSSTVIR